MSIRFKFISFFLIQLFSFSFSQNSPPPQNSVASILGQQSDYSTLLRLLRLTKLDTYIDDSISQDGMDGSLTLLAPNDQAFAALPTNAINNFNASGVLLPVLQYHLLALYILYDTLIDNGNILYATVEGSTVSSTVASSRVNFRGSNDTQATLVRSNLFANGKFSVQGIDGVLLPASAFTARASPPLPGVTPALPSLAPESPEILPPESNSPPPEASPSEVPDDEVENRETPPFDTVAPVRELTPPVVASPPPPASTPSSANAEPKPFLYCIFSFTGIFFLTLMM